MSPAKWGEGPAEARLETREVGESPVHPKVSSEMVFLDLFGVAPYPLGEPSPHSFVRGDKN